jgi:hypothetical protein
MNIVLQKMAKKVVVGVVFNDLAKKFDFEHDAISMTNYHLLVDSLKMLFEIEQAIKIQKYDKNLEGFFDLNLPSDLPIENFVKLKIALITQTSGSGSIGSIDSGISLESASSMEINETITIVVPSVLVNEIWRPNQFSIPLSKFSDTARLELEMAQATFDAMKLANPNADPPHHSASFTTNQEIRCLISTYLFNFRSYPDINQINDAVFTLIKSYPSLAIKGPLDNAGTAAWIVSITNKLKELRRHSDRADVLANKSRFLN